MPLVTFCLKLDFPKLISKEPYLIVLLSFYFKTNLANRVDALT